MTRECTTYSVPETAMMLQIKEKRYVNIVVMNWNNKQNYASMNNIYSVSPAYSLFFINSKYAYKSNNCFKESLV